tara:strand:+ start:1202 stop:2962 length:1761 start_codon:yes stop_codon:yes gene_type:complete
MTDSVISTNNYQSSTYKTPNFVGTTTGAYTSTYGQDNSFTVYATSNNMWGQTVLYSNDNTGILPLKISSGSKITFTYLEDQNTTIQFRLLDESDNMIAAFSKQIRNKGYPYSRATVDLSIGLNTPTFVANIQLNTKGAILKMKDIKIFDDDSVSINNPPQFDSVAPTTATEDVLYTYTPQVSDPDGDSLTITAPTLPGWLTFDGTTLSGIPRQSNPGANTVKLVVSDGTDTAEQDITIVVTLVNDAPVFTTAPVTSATAGLPYLYQPQVSDEENDTLTEITVGTLPEWLTFESGVLSGTPPLNADKLTDIELTVSETDTAEKLSTKQNFTITLNYDVKTITGGEYHKLPASGLGDSGEGFDYSIKQLIITTSTNTYNPAWYGAKTIIETDKVVAYEDGKVLVRDSRLDNADDSQIQQIAAEWAIQNNHYNFYYDVKSPRIFINESVAGNYILKDSSKYNTVFINQKREQVFGGRVILKERYSADFVMNEESTHQIDVSKILHQPGPLQLIPFEFPTWLTYDLVNGVYTLTGKPTDSKTQLAKINVKDADGNTYVFTVHVKVDLYNESKLVGKQLGDLTRDFETELL